MASVSKSGVYFHGDLIITDPGYVAKDAEDWKRCAYGDHMEKLGIPTVVTALVTEGEEDLCAVEPDSGSCYGTFVTDSGVAAAFLLEEILNYDPDFDEHIACPENALWIRDYDGTVTVHGQGEDQWLEGDGNHPFTTRTQDM